MSRSPVLRQSLCRALLAGRTQGEAAGRCCYDAMARNAMGREGVRSASGR